MTLDLRYITLVLGSLSWFFTSSSEVVGRRRTAGDMALGTISNQLMQSTSMGSVYL